MTYYFSIDWFFQVPLVWSAFLYILHPAILPLHSSFLPILFIFLPNYLFSLLPFSIQSFFYSSLFAFLISSLPSVLFYLFILFNSILFLSFCFPNILPFFHSLSSIYLFPFNPFKGSRSFSTYESNFDERYCPNSTLRKIFWY